MLKPKFRTGKRSNGEKYLYSDVWTPETPHKYPKRDGSGYGYSSIDAGHGSMPPDEFIHKKTEQIVQNIQNNKKHESILSQYSKDIETLSPKTQTNSYIANFFKKVHGSLFNNYTTFLENMNEKEKVLIEPFHKDIEKYTQIADALISSGKIDIEQYDKLVNTIKIRIINNNKPKDPTLLKSFISNKTKAESLIKKTFQNYLNPILDNKQKFEAELRLNGVDQDINMAFKANKENPYSIVTTPDNISFVVTSNRTYDDVISPRIKKESIVPSPEEYEAAIAEMPSSPNVIYQNPHITNYHTKKDDHRQSNHFLETISNLGYNELEVYSIDHYKGGGYTEMNSFADGDNDDYNELMASNHPDDIEKRKELQELVDNLDSALNRSVLAKEITVYRGLSKSRANIVLGLKPGEIYASNTFESTSHIGEEAQAFAHTGVALRVTLPKGTNGFEYGDVKWENEVLLPRKYGFRITDRRSIEGNCLYIDVELVELSEKDLKNRSAECKKIGLDFKNSATGKLMNMLQSKGNVVMDLAKKYNIGKGIKLGQNGL